MRRVLRSLAALAVLDLLFVCPPAMPQTRPAPDVRTWVKEHDKNGDGRLDREEFYQAAVESFFLRDKDKKGYLMLEDLKEVSPAVLKAVRHKDERRITLQEYVNALFADFQAADTDHDGELSVEEIEAYMRTAK